MAAKPVKIAIVDDHELVREAFVYLASSWPEVKVVMQACNGKDLLAQLEAAKHKPEVILMEVCMPEMDGYEATRLVKQRYPGIKVIALTAKNKRKVAYNMMVVKAESFLYKGTNSYEVRKVICSVHENGFYPTPLIEQAFMKYYNNRLQLVADKFSKREMEVLQLLCKDLYAKEIGDLLHISTRTVETHKDAMMKKTKAKSSLGLALFALRNELVE